MEKNYDRYLSWLLIGMIADYDKCLLRWVLIGVAAD